MRKVLVIGLDSATFDIIEPLIQKGQLPNLAKFMLEGSKGILQSVLPPLSPQAWSSFMTGFNPGRHGVFGFKEKLDGSYAFHFVNNKIIKSKTLWKLLSELGKKVVVINIPMTYPPEPVNGILISGMDAPGVSSDFTFPGEAKEEILKICPDYYVHLHVAGYLDSDEKRRKAVKDLYHMTQAREKVALHYLKNYDWDFYAINFAAIDQAQHHFWRYMADEDQNEFKNCIYDLYKRLDETVGRLTQDLDDEVTVFIMSDHGAGPISDVVVFIDEWLLSEGLVSFLGRDKKRGILKGFVRDFVERLYDFGVKIAPSNLKDSIQRLLPRFRGKARSFITQSIVDWEKTLVYSGENIGTLRVNLKGRDPNGKVRPDEYEDLLKKIIEKLESLENPLTKELLIDKVYRRGELYWGEHMDQSPDLIIWPKENKYRIQKRLFRKGKGKRAVAIKKRKGVETSGTHRLEGILFAKGPGIRKNAVVSQNYIYDLFPTILYAMDLDIPSGLDGKVIKPIFKEEYLKKKQIKFKPYDMNRTGQGKLMEETYSKDEAQQIEERLKGLGYLE